MFGFRFHNPRSQVRVERSFSELEPQEVLLRRLSRKASTEEEQRLEIPISQFLSRAFFFGFVFLASAFFLRTADFQVFSHNGFAAAARANAVRNIPLFAERGVIYDKTGEQLVFNESSFDLVCDQRDFPASPEDRRVVLEVLSQVTGTSFEELKKEFEDELVRPEVLAKAHLSHEQLLLWETKKEEVPGCQVRENIVRSYKDGPTFAHLLGYTAAISSQELQQHADYYVGEQIGKMGIEKAYEQELRGEPGAEIIERNTRGEVIRETARQDPFPGNNLVLHLDADLQRVATEALEATFARVGSSKGVVVVLDPNTGGVLAMASSPAYDNNVFSRGLTAEEWEHLQQDPSVSLFNKALQGLGNPTGSVIKPLIALAALEEGNITEETSLFAPLELCLENRYTKEAECFRDASFHGTTDVRRAIAESVNPFFYIVGGGHPDYQTKALGPHLIKQYLKLFGWGEKTGIDLPSEGSGILPTLDASWRLGNTYHFSIGQGPFAITPLQVASAFVAVANNGTLYAPQVVKEVVNQEKEAVSSKDPRVVRKDFVDAENLRIVREGMRQTVTAGSATGFLSQLPVTSAAKTGTAQTGRYAKDGKELFVAWTAAFAPFEDPEIVLVVMVEDVPEGQVGALPVVRDIFSWYFRE